MTFLRPQVGILTRRGAFVDLKLVDVPAMHVVLEREAVDAILVTGRQHNPTEQEQVAASHLHQCITITIIIKLDCHFQHALHVNLECSLALTIVHIHTII